MKYISLKDRNYTVDFEQAVVMGQAPERGLFYPAHIPAHNQEFLQNLKSFSREEVAFRVLQPFVAPSLSDDELRRIVSETVNFDFPLRQIHDRVFTLELFHGPTMAFKDVGARFMSRCLRYFLRNAGRKVTVLVATSGDTGGAVADAFYEVEGVDVVILYPKGKVSELQELQLTTYGGNVRALAVEGDFDACQALVKQAFAHEALSKRLGLTSANSINVARWLSQQVYYYFALQQWPLAQPPVVSVPSGNFGNICAGMVAWKRGLPVQKFVAACNENDAFAAYVTTGIFAARPAVATVSNAMDVGDPSNFLRVLEVFDNRYGDLKDQVVSFGFSSAETLEALRQVFREKGYLMDPHGAVGYLALRKYLEEEPGTAGLFLETAHPAKFEDAVRKATGSDVEMPEAMRELARKKKHMDTIRPQFDDLVEALG